MKRLTHSIIVIALVTVMASTVNARPGGTWLEVGPGGRAAGLAEAMTAAVQGPTATYWNPAMTGLSGSAIEMMMAQWIADGDAQYLAADFQHGKWGLAGSIMHVGFGDLELRDSPSVNPIGTFEARSYAIGVSISRELPLGIRVGATGRYLSDQIYSYVAKGWSADVGLYRAGLIGGRLDLAATVRHLGEMGELNIRSYDLPTTMSAGAVYHLGKIWATEPALLVDVVQVKSFDLAVRAGVEIEVSDLVSLRSGYATGYEAQGFTAGFGIHWKNWKFDLGYSPFIDDLGATQRYSLTVVW